MRFDGAIPDSERCSSGWRDRRLDENGHSQFNELLFRRGTPRFCAFDLLWLNGRDMRKLPLIKRKRNLRKLIPAGCDSLLYVDHIEARARCCLN